MKTQPVRNYKSPLRAAHAQDTRERILAAVGKTLSGSADGSISFDQLAEESGVERRTVFRHFPNKEALLDAFWDWPNSRANDKTFPTTLTDLLTLPERTFKGFDAQEGIIRASLHTQSGREMRLRSVPQRRKAFKAALQGVTHGLPPKEIARAEAAVQALFSASTWETLRDNCGLSGKEAGQTVSWAVWVIVEKLKRDARTKSPKPSQQNQ